MFNAIRRKEMVHWGPGVPGPPGGPGTSRGSRGLPGVLRDVKCDRVWGPGRSHRASGSSLGLLRSPLVGSLRSPRDLGLRPRTCNFYCFRYAQGARRWGALYLCAGLSCEEGTVSADSIRILDTWGLKYTYPYTENVKYPKSIHVSMRLPGPQQPVCRVAAVRCNACIIVFGR